MGSQFGKTPRVCLAVLGLLLLWGAAAFSRRVTPAATRWSAAETWQDAGQTLPRRGGAVTIPAGQTVWLDVSPPPLAHLTINGTLIVPDTADFRLNVGQIEVNGMFRIGTEAAPFQHQFTLTLSGEKAERMVSVQNGGRLEWHGAETGASWLHLAAAAPKGATTITVENAVPRWGGGDRIVLASTDFDAHQAEERTITAIRGNEITLNAPLAYTHWGQSADGVDERGEVALLTRHIVVQGSEQGGCVMMMAGSVARLSAVEFRQLGKRGRKGSYPVHFHQAGDASASVVRACSIHHCFNRSLTIHGTQNLRVQDNVSFDTVGHAYFLEDGDETGNQLIHNLGLLTRAAPKEEAILPSDTTPATFWITNPDNVVTGNVAAGSDFHGFWYSLPKHPTGLAQSAENDRTSWPRQTPLGVFTDNTAHSNAHDGLFVDNGPNAPGETETPNYAPREKGAPVIAVFDRFTAYKNRRRGAWLRGDHLRLARARLADNSVGVTLAASESLVEDSLVVGETANRGTAAFGEPTGRGGRALPKPQEPHTPLCGFEFYDGQVGIVGTTFVHFRSDAVRPAGALGCLRYSPFYVSPRNFAERLRFVDANAVFFADKGEPGDPRLSGDGYRSVVFQDRDGSLTGQAGSSVGVPNPLLQNDHSVFRPDWNAVVCADRFGHLFVDNRDKEPLDAGPVAFSRDTNDPAAPTPYRVFGSPVAAGKPAVSFQTNLRVNAAYRVAFGAQTPATYRIALRDCAPGDGVVVGVEDADGSVTVRAAGGKKPLLVEVPTRAALENADGFAVYRDRGRSRTYIKIATNAATARTGAAVLISRTSAMASAFKR